MFVTLCLKQYTPSSARTTDWRRTLSRSPENRRVSERRPGVAIVLPQGFEALKNWEPGLAAAVRELPADRRAVVDILRETVRDLPLDFYRRGN